MAPSDRDFVPPFSEGRFALMKSMLPFLPPDAARLFLPLCQMMELKELLAKFEWERTHLLSACQTPKPFDTASLLESLRASLPPEQSEQQAQHGGYRPACQAYHAVQQEKIGFLFGRDQA